MSALATEISDHPFLHSMSEQHQAILLECATRRTFEGGQIIFREGEPANRFYLIERGVIDLEAVTPNHEVVRVQSLQAGDVLGWSWLFEPFVWSFQARAVEPVTAIVFDAAHLLRLSNEDSDFGYRLMKRVAQVVLRTLQATRRRLIETTMATKA